VVDALVLVVVIMVTLVDTGHFLERQWCLQISTVREMCRKLLRAARAFRVPWETTLITIQVWLRRRLRPMRRDHHRRLRPRVPQTRDFAVYQVLDIPLLNHSEWMVGMDHNDYLHHLIETRSMRHCHHHHHNRHHLNHPCRLPIHPLSVEKDPIHHWAPKVPFDQPRLHVVVVTVPIAIQQ
jgi:hypothetical protein